MVFATLQSRQLRRVELEINDSAGQAASEIVDRLARAGQPVLVVGVKSIASGSSTG
jgi:hypothetical protein